MASVEKILCDELLITQYELRDGEMNGTRVILGSSPRRSVGHSRL